MAADTDEWNSELRTTATFCGPTVARTKIRYVVNGGGGTNFVFGFTDPDRSSYPSVLVSTNVFDTITVEEFNEESRVSSLGTLPTTMDTDWRMVQLTAEENSITVNVDRLTAQFETELDWASREKAIFFRVKTLATDGDDVSAAFDSLTAWTR